MTDSNRAVSEERLREISAFQPLDFGITHVELVSMASELLSLRSTRTAVLEKALLAIAAEIPRGGDDPLFNTPAEKLVLEALRFLSTQEPSQSKGEGRPLCRICGSPQWVAIWREEAPEQAICMNCCDTGQHEHENGETGHEFNRGSALEVPSCIHCGMERGR